MASLLRRLGLGRLVEAARPTLAPAFESFVVEVEGVKLQLADPHHVAYVRELEEHGREAYFLEAYRESIRPGATVLDAGAHIGLTALVAAQRAGRVLVFEPNPEVLPVLERNVRLNRCEDRVTIVPKALGDRKGTARLFVTGGGDTSSLVDPGDASRGVEVEVATADELLGGTVPDVVKLDIEGGEPAALRGMRRTLAGVETIFVECNPELLARAGESAEGLVAQLEAAHFVVRVIDEERRELVPFAGPPPAGVYVNLCCTRAVADSAATTSV